MERDLSDSPVHLTSVTEKGSFTTAQCSCGWAAPARRSRDKTRKDAAGHLAAAAGAAGTQDRG